MKKTLTREEWLNKVLVPIRRHFKRCGYEVPEKIRVSCAFTSRGTGGKAMRIGECWDASVSSDKTIEIFISPTLEAFAAVDTLCHEVVHAVVGCKHGHKKPFVDCCKAVGLTKGKPTSVGAGDELRAEIGDWLKKLPPYPHAKLNARGSVLQKQTTRLVKMQCGGCGTIIRTTWKWIDLWGESWPCPCGDGELFYFRRVVTRL